MFQHFNITFYGWIVVDKKLCSVSIFSCFLPQSFTTNVHNMNRFSVVLPEVTGEKKLRSECATRRERKQTEGESGKRGKQVDRYVRARVR